jgi:D-beta-D-heptose 7-phosphate kinase/D-beta-D-heptose 1-phosphate adenosyltransferase
MIDGPALPPLAGDRARALLAAMPGARVVVLGDVMLDHFVIGRVSRISPEAPVPVVEFDREFHLPGGAANVASNVRALGAHVALVGVVGDDASAADMRGLLEGRGIAAAGVITDPSRPTTRKTRLATTRHQQVARLDVEKSDDLGAEVEAAVIASLEAAIAAADAIVVSDYMKGVVTRRVMAHAVAGAAARGVPLLVDPKVPHMPYYAGASLITPNQPEAEQASLVRIRTADDARRAVQTLRERFRVDGVLVTLGEQGMWLADGSAEGHLPATAREVADVTGAGDTVVATLAAALAAGATSAEAARLANEAAGVVVTRFGTAVASLDDLRARLG